MIARLLKRSVVTAVKLPFAAAWDCISLGNMGEGSSTGKILRDHQEQKAFDDAIHWQNEISEAVRNRQALIKLQAEHEKP